MFAHIFNEGLVRHGTETKNINIIVTSSTVFHVSNPSLERKALSGRSDIVLCHALCVAWINVGLGIGRLARMW